MTAALFYHSPELPWSVSAEDQRRFRRILGTVTAVALLLSLIMPLLPVPEQAADKAPEMPPRYARLLMERKPPPPPPRPVVKEQPRPKPKPEPKEARKAEQAPKPKKAKPRPSPRPRPSAREKAARSGLLAFSQELAALRTHSAVASVSRQDLRKSSAGKAPRVERAILTRRARQASGGIDTARLSRDTGKTPLATRHETTRVESSLAQVERHSHAGRRGEGGLPTRSDEDIQLVFDRNKGRLYALYNRALRKNPTLRGKLVLRLTIDPDGRVTACEIVNSELKDPRLERRLVARIKMFDFGAREVAVTRITYPIEFFPG